MRKRIGIMICLMLLLTVSVGKLTLSWVEHNQEAVFASEDSNVKTPALATVEKDKADVLFQSGKWLVDELIPSAEAAKSIQLDEENTPARQGKSVSELQARSDLLDSREDTLNEREIALQDIAKRAQDKVVALEALQTRIEDLLQQEESIKDKKIKRLTSVYEGMKADKAAPIIAQMQLDVVVKMFLRMNEKQVGKILSFLPPQQAVVVSQALTERVASIKK